MPDCPHTLRLGSLCTHCGQSLPEDSKSFCLLHTNDSLKMSEKEAKSLARKRKKQLDKEKRLILIFDLDQTVLHAAFNKECEVLFLNGYKEVCVDDHFGDVKNVDDGSLSKDDIPANVIVRDNDGILGRENIIDKNTDNLCDDIGNKDTIIGIHEEILCLKKETHNETNINANSCNGNDDNYNLCNNEVSCITTNTKLISDEVSIIKEDTKKESVLCTDSTNINNNDIALIKNTVIKDEKSIKTNQTQENHYKRHKKQIPFNDLNDDTIIYTFTIQNTKHYIKIRPHFLSLIKSCQDKFEMHVYTMGIREYANKIMRIIDPLGIYFDNRIITRDENENMKKKSLDRLSSIHKNIVVLDDRGDVWNYCCNLLVVKRFSFFRTGDINAPEKIINGNNTAVLTVDTNNDMYSNIDENFNASGKTDTVIDENAKTTNLEDHTKQTKNEKNNKVNIDSVIFSTKDEELIFIQKVLSDIHIKYFSSFTKDIKSVLKGMRWRIFNDLYFYIDKSLYFEKKLLKRVIRNCGGKVSKKEVSHILSNRVSEKTVKKYQADVVDFRWVYACNMYFCRVDVNNFVMKSFVDEDMIKELEDALE